MTDTAAISEVRTAKIGPGRLVLVVGPSGAGKDTLIDLARAACAGEDSVVFARRVVTREASGSEDNEQVTPDAFRQARARGAFAVHWEAHGLHKAGIGILMGAPNVVRNGSHSGNIAAIDLAREGMLDILSSDYVPSSLLMGALQLATKVPSIDLAAAVRTVTKRPAEAVGLADRGENAIGKRADVIRVHVAGDVAVVRSVWREGRRVA